MTESMYGRRPVREEFFDGTTDASGNVSFSYSRSFSVLPDIRVHLHGKANQRISFSVTSESVSGCTINVQEPAIVNVLGINVVAESRTNVSGQRVRVVVRDWS